MHGSTCAGLWVTGLGKDTEPREVYLYNVVGNEDTVSGLRNYTDVGPDLVGAEWRVEMFL